MIKETSVYGSVKTIYYYQCFENYTEKQDNGIVQWLEELTQYLGIPVNSSCLTPNARMSSLQFLVHAAPASLRFKWSTK